MTKKEVEAWEDLSGISADPPEMRDKCCQCRRPRDVCWCPGLVQPPLNPSSRVIILQHPAEIKRSLQTAPMLTLGLESNKCLVFRGKKFPTYHHQGLREILEDDATILLYPSTNSQDINQLKKVGVEEQKPYNLVLLDGTWPQAKAMFHASPLLGKLKTCKLVGGPVSEYVVRTQPTEGCLSTLESAAISLSILENQPSLKDDLINPLRYLCKYQLERGSLTHHSKELLIKQNNYPKLVGKRLKKQLKLNC